MTKSTDTVSLSGQMVVFTEVNGKTANSTEKDYTFQQMVRQGMASGKMVKGRNGYNEDRLRYHQLISFSNRILNLSSSTIIL